MRSPLVGPAYAARSLNLASQECVNLYPEVVETKTGKDVAALYLAPGLSLLNIQGSGPIRAMFNDNGTLYAVSGNLVYANGSLLTGSLTTSTGPVGIVSNGFSLLMVDGTNAYHAASGVVATVSLPFSGPSFCTYQDGFGIIGQAGSAEFFQSDPYDFTSWNSLNFSTAGGQADWLVAGVDVHRELWLIKRNTAEVWYNAGTTNFAFARIDGVFIEYGCEAPGTVQTIDGYPIWLGRNKEGARRVVQMEGYKAVRVSTHALETHFDSFTTVADATAYTYQQEGHTFYVLRFPTAGETWAIDLTATAQFGAPMWHQRASFANGHFGIHPVQCVTEYAGLVLAGDATNGNVYVYDLDNATDNGAQRKWLRSWRALPKPMEMPTRFSSLRIDMETGLQVPDGTAPLVDLEWSDDGGHTWTSPISAAAGPTGQTAQRVMFRRLGATRRNHGLDRTFRLSSTDQFKVALIGAELN